MLSWLLHEMALLKYLEGFFKKSEQMHNTFLSKCAIIILFLAGNVYLSVYLSLYRT